MFTMYIFQRAQNEKERVCAFQLTEDDEDRARAE